MILYFFFFLYMHVAKVNPSIIILLDTTIYIYWTVITKIPTRENYNIICMEKFAKNSYLTTHYWLQVQGITEYLHSKHILVLYSNKDFPQF